NAKLLASDVEDRPLLSGLRNLDVGFGIGVLRGGGFELLGWSLHASVLKMSREKFLSGEPHTDRKFCSSGEFAGADLWAIGRLHAHDADAAVGTDHGEAVAIDRDDLAHLAGDPFGTARRQRLGVENLQLLAVQVGPGA